MGESMCEHDSRHRRAHHRKIDEMLRIGADGRADVEHDRFAAQRRPDRRDRRPLDRRHRVQAELRHRHQGAGVAGGDRAVGRARLHRFDRLPHRRDAPPGAQGLTRLVAHLDRDVGMKNARLRGEPGMTRKDGPNRRLVAIEEKLNVGTAFERDGGGGHDDRRPVIAPHRVQRYANVARHSLVRPPGPRCPGGAARRDNSGSVAQGNARNSGLVAAKLFSNSAKRDAARIARMFATRNDFGRRGFDIKAAQPRARLAEASLGEKTGDLLPALPRFAAIRRLTALFRVRSDEALRPSSSARAIPWPSRARSSGKCSRGSRR